MTIGHALLVYVVLFIIAGVIERQLLTRVLNLLIAIDQMLWVLVTLGAGHPDETISSASWRYEQKGNWIGKIARPTIDLLFKPFEDNHCYKAYMAEISRAQSFNYQVDKDHNEDHY